MENAINVARHKTFPYTVNFKADGGSVKQFTWNGSTGKKIDIKAIPEEVVDWLITNTVCFKEGELKIVDEDAELEFLDNVSEEDKESYLNNTNSKSDIVKLLEGNANTMKAKLEKITTQTEKLFVIEVAKEIKLDSSTKQKFLAEWAGYKAEDVDLLFSDTE
jgi:hypothetical protein